MATYPIERGVTFSITARRDLDARLLFDVPSF